MKKIITGFENESVIELNDDNSQLFEMAEDLALRNSSIFTVTIENGKKVIKAGHYAGLVRFNDGTQIEIFPKICADAFQARKMTGRMMSAYLDIPFEAQLAEILESPESSFMEFFISIFVRECMKILKSGLLSGYTSIEENTTSMQGSIMFSENIRKNLAHRERLYVRHDVFTPDRAENRLIKATAKMMTDLVCTHHNEQELKKILIFLDGVNDTISVERDFSACVNTRNAKKYTTVLSICRMMLRKNISGKFVSRSVMIPMQEIFKAYITKLAKVNMQSMTISAKNSGKFLCPNQKLFPIKPNIVVREKDGSIFCIADIRWTWLKHDTAIPFEDMLCLCSYSLKFGCSEIFLIYPSSGKREDISFDVDFGTKATVTVKFVDLSDGSPAAELYDEEYIEDLEDLESYETDNSCATDRESEKEDIPKADETYESKKIPEKNKIQGTEKISENKQKTPSRELVKRKVKVIKKHKK